MSLQEHVFDTGEVRINYAEGPRNGPAFVVLHGGSARWQAGATLLDSLARDWHVYAPDFRGHGKSGRVPAAYNLTDYARDIAAFVSEGVAAPAVIFGHSLGGEVGVMVAARHPELAAALIVGDAPLSIRNSRTESPQHRAQNLLWIDLAGRPIPEIERALRDSPVFVAGQADPSPARAVMGEEHPWFAYHAINLHQLDPDMLAAVLAGPERMLAGYDPEVLLPRITCPVLLLQADARGPLQPAALADDDVALGLRLLPRATLVSLSGIGHPLHGPPDQTQRVLEAMTPFLLALRGSS